MTGENFNCLLVVLSSPGDPAGHCLDIGLRTLEVDDRDEYIENVEENFQPEGHAEFRVGRVDRSDASPLVFLVVPVVPSDSVGTDQLKRVVVEERPADETNIFQV